MSEKTRPQKFLGFLIPKHFRTFYNIVCERTFLNIIAIEFEVSET